MSSNANNANNNASANVAQIAGFDEVIDARSPAEYAEDHLPGALSCPVLDDEQRARVGTIYKQESPFAAKKIGAALVARNIADHIERLFLDRPRHWRPLVYCWRGGQRSGAFTHILRQIGWNASQLEGGYKSWRRHIVASLATLPQTFQYIVLSGTTGSGKSRLLEALETLGAQTLHLEQMAAHKGSLLGNLPDTPQPSQKMFESRLFTALERFDPARPVFVEAESRRIGSVQLPDAMLQMIHSSPGLRIEADTDVRVAFLLRDYDYFLADPAWLIERIGYLHGMQPNETLTHWQALANDRAFPQLVEELLEQHYDPLYRRSQAKSKAASNQSPLIRIDDLSPAGIERTARQVLADFAA